MRVALLVVLASCVVTRAPKLHERPHWKLSRTAAWESGCALGNAFVRKSGKPGFGVAVELKSKTDCALRIAGGTLRFSDGTKVVVPPIAAFALRGRSLVYAWVPVRFDNNLAWNEGRNTATLSLDMIVAGAASTFAIDVEQRW